ncbi:hypothetical protein EV359DRAFT_80091 [Lentinula novae-zelandiae]|uniref:DRBM domain-containing protein n=1 Tax=Lentinula lateritia TaxID=40482 RepID=A0ABQ8VB70_9AGAR|nr:hypothetical protein EV359DRAFT_80091 [Lentinula novae-zelandiae]KAJ4484636.1 hypothetical protein C8R41DRAFT_921560 [Lentinula lateritia]
MSDSEYIHALNNLAQSRHLTVSYSNTHTGTQHGGVWISIVYINGVEHGRATCTTRKDAQKAAARIALSVLELV